MAFKDNGRKSFTIPATSGNYASERMNFGVRGSAQSSAGTPLDFLGITAVVESAPAGASLELWLPKVGADLNAFNDADFFFFGTLVSGAAGATQALASVPAAQLRAKSGGNAGAMPVNGWVD